MHPDGDATQQSPGQSPSSGQSSGQRLCLITHLGLGDMILLNGMVRIACQKYSEVLLFVKKAYANSLRSLLYDLTNLRLKFVTEHYDLEANDFEAVRDVLAAGYLLMPTGHYTTDDWQSLDPIWSRALYRQVGLDPDSMYAEFRVQRNEDREARMLEKVRGHVGMAYVVLHDDPARGYVIDRSCLPPGLPVVHVDDPRWRADNIFDYAEVIDNAVQFHGFDSCFMLMADFLQLCRSNFCHAYLKDSKLPERFYRTGITIVRDPPPAARRH
jgi:hypothetical protein